METEKKLTDQPSNCILQLKRLSRKVKELTCKKVTKPNEKMKNHIQIQENILRRNEWHKVYLLERMIACRIQLAHWGLGGWVGRCWKVDYANTEGCISINVFLYPLELWTVTAFLFYLIGHFSLLCLEPSPLPRRETLITCLQSVWFKWLEWVCGHCRVHSSDVT